ncbi:MAG: T9SS type A sorting domain-containing protein [Psychroserpens sp.]|uniref:T9SS type A sorting domain-containing protein n=1 Tax=Psychroserpens sp. TaxID=2020870 RepID=UPI0030028718
MSNFTRSGGRAKIWQSITNLSCCIDFMTRRSKSMKAFAFIMLFAFSTVSVFAQDLERSTFFNRCQNDAPPGPSEADVANLYLTQCGDLLAEVVKSTLMEGNDCAWNVEYTYDVKCGAFEEQIKISYNGGDITPPELNDGAELPTGDTGLILCYNAIPSGPSIGDITALYSDNCSDVFVTKSGTPNGNDCEWDVTYTYTVKDACLNMVAEDLVITYTGGDTQAPTLNKGSVIPGNMDGIEACFNAKPAGPTVEEILALFSDNCGNVYVTKSAASKSSDGDCKWLAEYTYTIKDDCDNYADTIIIVYTGGDTVDPVLSGVPNDTTVDCIDQIPEPDYKLVSATDNCAVDLEIIVTDDISQLGDSCTGGVVVRTYRVTDDCGFSDSETQTITVLPTPEATLNVPELPTSISCEEAAGFLAANATYSNGIDEGACAVSGSIEANVNPQYTECGGTITVSYDGVDSCDRPLSAGPYIITVDPAPVAVFNGVQDISIACYLADQYEVNPLGYSNGGTGVCEISGSAPGSLSGSYDECGGTLYVDWTYTDDCNRTITAKKTITVLPAPEAEFEEVLDMEISCEEANLHEAGSLSYTNGGTGACEISGSVLGEATPDYDECGGVISVSWTYTDDCERTITANKTITVLPAPMATFEEVLDMEITCEQANSFEAGSLSYTNGGTGVCEISGSVLGLLSGTYDECGGTLYVDWSYTDDCQRTITAKKQINVLPAPAAEFEEVLDMEITCEEANAFQAGSLSYTNGGTGACEISGSVPGEATPDYDECGGVITVNWTYTDDCQRTISASKTVTVLPAPQAEFELVEHITITCEEANNLQVGSLPYTNGGTGVCEISGSVPGELSGEYDECGGLLFIDWTYTDDCGRTITARQQVKVNPAPEAEFEEVLDMEITCEQANLYEAGSLSYTNGGTGLCEISGSVPGELSGSYDECGGTLYVNWTYTDKCDRTITASKTIIVLPAPGAEFEEVLDMEISCEQANSYEAGSLSYTNGGTGICEISGSVPGLLSGSYDECGGTLYVDWTYTDDCLRTITAKKTIIVLPAPAAEFEEVLDMEITCEEANLYEAGSLSYTNGGTGACEISGSVAGEATPDYDECGGVITVNWTYTDDCQRTITASKTVTVLPAPMAEFEEVLDMEITCEEANSFEAGSLSYTNGGTGTCEISGSVPGLLSGAYDECGGTLYIDWAYTDDCQRTITAKKTIIVLPAPAATFEEVLDMEISCEEAEDFTANYLAQGFVGDFDAANWNLDLSNGSIAINAVDMTIIGNSGSGGTTQATATCPVSGTYSFDWDYANPDDSAYWDPAFYVNGVAIDLTDGSSVQFDSGSLSVNCAAGDVIGFGINSLDGLGDGATLVITNFSVGSANMLAYTNGGTGACEISGAVPGLLSGAYDECGGTLYIDWSYTDDCGRTITAQKVITVLPAPQAEFETVEDMTITCEEAAAIVSTTLVEDFTNPGEIYPFEGLAAANVTADPQDGNNQVLELISTDAGQPWQGAGLINNIDLTNTKSMKIDVLADQAFDLLVKVENTPNDFAETGVSYTNVGQWQTLTVSFDQPSNGEATDQVYPILALFPNWNVGANGWNEAPGNFAVYVDNIVVGGPGCLSYTNGGTGACEISGSVPGEVTGTYDECGGLLEVDYTFTDDCNRTITAKKIITVLPAPEAVFESVENMTVSCEDAEDFTANYLVEGFVGDFDAANWNLDLSSGSIAINAVDMTIIGNSGSGGITQATATCPVSGTYSFDWDYANPDDSAYWDPAFYVNGVAIDLTDGSSVQFDSGSLSVNCAAGDVIGFGINSLDGLGDGATLVITNFSVGSANMLAYTNGGTGACEISGAVPGLLSGAYDECGGTLYIDWSYTDDCGRTITAQKVITVEPAPTAEFATILDASIACEDLATYEPEFLSYTNGGTGACEISGSVQGVADAFEGSCGTFEVNFTFTDDCGNTITAKHVITVIDETAPTLVGEAPGGESFINACFGNRPEGPSISEITDLFVDNCGNVNVTKDETVVESSDCQWAVFYVYTISDDCGNFANNIKISYFGGDDNAPVLTGTLPNGVTGLQCYGENPGVSETIVADITAAYIDDCGEVIVTPLEPIFTGDDCGWTATYTYTVQDSCGNFANNVVIVNSGADTINPEYNGDLDDTFTNTTLCFDSPLGEPSADDMKSMFSDNCDSDLTITKTVQAFGSDCQWLKVFIYTATDDCGNVSDLIKINYEGLDVEAPVFDLGCQLDVVIGTMDGAICPDDAEISLNINQEIDVFTSWTVGGIEILPLVGCVSDNCSADEELVIRVKDKTKVGDDCSQTLTITFVAIDACGKISEDFVCVYTIIDDTAPVVTCPVGQDYGLVTEAPTGFADKANYTDNCQADGETQDFTDSVVSVVSIGTENFIIECIRISDDVINSTWTYTRTGTDNNGYATYDALISTGSTGHVSYNADLGQFENFVDGDADPAWINVTDALSASCLTEDWDYVVPGGVHYLNAICVNSGASTRDYTLVRTFTANDGCDNTATCDVVYTWSYELSSCDNAEVLDCGAVVSGDTSVTGSSAVDGQDCVSFGEATGVWYTVVGTGNPIVVSTCSENTTHDTYLSAYSDCGITCVANNDDNFTCEHSSLHSQIEFDTVAGEEYKIFVSGFAGGVGAYELSVECLTACEAADEIQCGDIVSGDTTNGTPVYDGQDCTSSEFSTGDWYSFVGTGDLVTFSTCSANTMYDTYLSAYTDCGTTCVVNNDDDFSCEHSVFHSSIQVQTEVGQEYKIYVSGFSTSEGAYDLSVTCETPVTATIVDCGGDGETVAVNNYPNNVLLEWAFTSSTGDPLTINFDGSTEAGFDEIFVYDGLDATAPFLGVFTGDLTGQSVTTTGDSVYVTFDSDGSVSGFSFIVDVACGQLARQAQEDVKIDFTAFPVPFDNEVNIAYTFEFETNVTIELFDTKGLQVFSETNKDYVAGSNGRSTFDLSRYSSQMFYVKLTTSQGSVTKKIVSSGK